MDYRVLTEAERKYTFSQSQQLSMQTGLIGYLRADFGSTGNEFWTTWNDFRKDLKTDEFKAEFDDVINGLRDGMFCPAERLCPLTVIPLPTVPLMMTATTTAFVLIRKSTAIL